MSWLKSLNGKRFLKLFGQNSTLEKRRFSFKIRWNQTTKVMTGLLASVCSMMALMTFFGSLEEPASIDASLSEETDLGFELGASDELSLEFGLDASLPVQGSELESTANVDTISPQSELRTASVQQVGGTVPSDADVYHAVGQEFENQQSVGQIKQVATERPIYINGLKTAVPSRSSAGSGAVWLTGEIEETDDLPLDATVRRVRN